ncbi:MAG: CAP domain-containing protein, partial [Sphingomicrobium sp.]
TGDWSQCGHYTQMVWPTTTDIGCGYARGRFDALVCRYSPPGNKDGVALAPGFPLSTDKLAQRLCTTPRGVTIPCQNAPGGVQAGDGPAGGIIQDGGGGDKDSGAKEEVACSVDVNVHQPISLEPDEPVVAEELELVPGATTLRNDDSDWRIGAVEGDRLPIVTLPTDLTQLRNADENDLVKVDAINPQNLPRVYIFAFPTHVEAGLDLAAPVDPVIGGRHANEQELAFFDSATKAAPEPGLPLVIPRPVLSFWLEAKLGGRYRLVIGKLKDEVQPGDVRYDRETDSAYVKGKGAGEKPFICDDQATVTAAVVDIFQKNINDKSKRLTAFDVYWGGRPHFRADVWPGAQNYSWGEKYRLGAAEQSMPGVAVDNEQVASMVRDKEDVDRDENARFDGPKVTARGTANGNFRTKGRIDGGFQMDAPKRNNVPTVNRAAGDRYPKRVSLEYVVDGKKLVRAEYLEVILPKVHPPAASMIMGSMTRVASEVHYEIVDVFDRPIIADGLDDYLYLYGAGMKAWEALEGQPDRVIETGPRFEPDDFNDYLFIINTGLNGRGEQRPPVGPLGTAQRSQTRVREDRMKAGTFQDTLIFTAPPDTDDREALWKAATGRISDQAMARARAEAENRDDALHNRVPEGKRYKTAKERRTDLEERRAAVPQADQARIASSPVLAIPQDVILQLRVGAQRHDLMVFRGNRLSVLAPFFYDDTKFPGDKNQPVFRYHMRFTPGAVTSLIVEDDYDRPGQ